MEIKDFIKETLLQIVDGVSTANEALQDKGAFIPTKGLIGEGVLFRVEEGNTTKHCIKVDGEKKKQRISRQTYCE